MKVEIEYHPRKFNSKKEFEEEWKKEMDPNMYSFPSDEEIEEARASIDAIKRVLCGKRVNAEIPGRFSPEYLGIIHEKGNMVVNITKAIKYLELLEGAITYGKGI